MPEPVQYDIWGVAEAVGIAVSAALATLGGMLGIQKKQARSGEDRHDNSRAAIRALQDRCKDLENEVDNLKEKVASQAVMIKEAEHKQETLARLMFEKLDAMNETLIAIRVALGIKEATHGKG